MLPNVHFRMAFPSFVRDIIELLRSKWVSRAVLVRMARFLSSYSMRKLNVRHTLRNYREMSNDELTEILRNVCSSIILDAYHHYVNQSTNLTNMILTDPDAVSIYVSVKYVPVDGVYRSVITLYENPHHIQWGTVGGSRDPVLPHVSIGRDGSITKELISWNHQDNHHMISLSPYSQLRFTIKNERSRYSKNLSHWNMRIHNW